MSVRGIFANFSYQSMLIEGEFIGIMPVFFVGPRKKLWDYQSVKKFDMFKRECENTSVIDGWTEICYTIARPRFAKASREMKRGNHKDCRTAFMDLNLY